MSADVTPELDSFLTRILDQLQRLLPQEGAAPVIIEASTPLFETGLLDSLRFTEFMVALEAELGVVVPDAMLSLEYFQTPRIIAESFHDRRA